MIQFIEFPGVTCSSGAASLETQFRSLPKCFGLNCGGDGDTPRQIGAVESIDALHYDLMCAASAQRSPAKANKTSIHSDGPLALLTVSESPHPTAAA